jgi:membrane protein
MSESRRGHLVRSSRERLRTITADGRSRLELARTRLPPVDVGFRFLYRSRPVALGMLASAIAFRLFLLLLPLAYLVASALSFLGAADPEGTAQLGRRAGLSALLADSVAGAVRTSERGRWLALAFGIVTSLAAASGVATVLRGAHALAWGLPQPRGRRSARLVLGLLATVLVVAATTSLAASARATSPELGLVATVAAGAVYFGVSMAASWFLPRPAVPWPALVPGALLFAVGLQGYHVLTAYYFVPKAARTSAVYGSLGVALVVLAALSLVGLLVVAAAELNAVLWERRTARSRRQARDPG